MLERRYTLRSHDHCSTRSILDLGYAFGTLSLYWSKSGLPRRSLLTLTSPLVVLLADHVARLAIRITRSARMQTRGLRNWPNRTII